VVRFVPRAITHRLLESLRERHHPSVLPCLREGFLSQRVSPRKLALEPGQPPGADEQGELFGVPPTGQRLSIESITVERVSDGKIRDHWRITRSLDMMQQLGAIPTPEHA
jgi:hypothetical protein